MRWYTNIAVEGVILLRLFPVQENSVFTDVSRFRNHLKLIYVFRTGSLLLSIRDGKNAP